VRCADGKIVESRRVRTAQLQEYLARRPPSRVIIEASTAAFSLADQVRAMGHEPRVVRSTLAPQLVKARRTKTDRRDADALSEMSCVIDIPSIHIPSLEAREHKAICASRSGLIAARTQLINTVRAWLRRDGRTLRSTPENFAARLRTALETIPAHIEQVLAVVDALNAQIKRADREVNALAKSDPVCRRLMSVPGVGPVTAVLFKAVVDDVTRFKSAHAVESYLGLVPGEHSSSERKHRLSITKAGSIRLRAVLLQAAWSARRCKRVPRMVEWSLEVEKRRGKHVAVVALARKLVGVLYAMWRDGTEFDMSR
jgi:transposase